MAANSRIAITRHLLVDTTIGGRVSEAEHPVSKHTAALHAFVAAPVEHGDHVGEDEQGRVVVQVAFAPWVRTRRTRSQEMRKLVPFLLLDIIVS